MTKPWGSFSSPGYPVAYPLATDCIWEIETEPGSRVELTITQFDIESGGRCAFDFLQVLDVSWYDNKYNLKFFSRYEVEPTKHHLF